MVVELLVVMFQGVIGLEDLVECGFVLVVEVEDFEVMVEVIVCLLDCLGGCIEMIVCVVKVIVEEIGFIDYVFDLLKIVGCLVLCILVIVFSYNYEVYICDWLDSVIVQDMLVLEIIVLDDCFIDCSLDIIVELVVNSFVFICFVLNIINFGNVFW